MFRARKKFVGDKRSLMAGSLMTGSTVLRLYHGSYKQKLMEFKAFQGFSRPNHVHEVWSHDKNLTNFQSKISFLYDFHLHSALGKTF